MVIGVTGATGTIGRHLLGLLAARGATVRAYSRDPDRVERWPGVTPVRTDLADRDALPAALDGVRALFLLTGNADDMVRLQKNAIAAARRAGVERLVKLSALGATDHSRSVIGLWHYNIERVLRATGLGWTILRPHHFMQNLLDRTVFDRRCGRIRSASGSGAVPFVDSRDIAAAAAVILTEGGHRGEIHTLTGPEAITYGGATEILSRVLDRPLTFVAESDDDAWRRLRAAGLPTWLVAARIAIASYQRAGGPSARVTDAIERLTGRPARTLREFAESHAEALAAL
ncbi:MAG: SDR family oxidoreductase [Gemmatimonadota bacterium]